VVGDERAEWFALGRSGAVGGRTAEVAVVDHAARLGQACDLTDRLNLAGGQGGAIVLVLVTFAVILVLLDWWAGTGCWFYSLRSRN
jgi:hypothetical protein